MCLASWGRRPLYLDAQNKQARAASRVRGYPSDSSLQAGSTLLLGPCKTTAISARSGIRWLLSNPQQKKCQSGCVSHLTGEPHPSALNGCPRQLVLSPCVNTPRASGVSTSCSSNSSQFMDADAVEEFTATGDTALLLAGPAQRLRGAYRHAEKAAVPA